MNTQERFEAWLTAQYGNMFPANSDPESSTAVRLVRLVAMDAALHFEATAIERCESVR